MSILNKKWKLRHERQEGEDFKTALLKARKLQNAEDFFADPDFSNLHDPFLFEDMQKAVERIQKAIRGEERIVIYGDYDVDGISGTALLVHTLLALGAKVSYRIPHRLKDGYGLHDHFVDELLKADAKLLITVDCGISCAAQVQKAEEGGMNVLITDHHTLPPELPKAFAILHPELSKNYPFKKLSGSGVAFKLASAISPELAPKLLDLASLGTVADCVTLSGENRLIVQLGLQRMQQTNWPGLRALLDSSGISEKPILDSGHIGFQIGPRLNASGRMDHPYWGLQTLLSEDAISARTKAAELEKFNQERRALTEKILEEAKANLNLEEDLIIEHHSSWPSPLVGLIAGRLQEEFSKPAFVMEDRGEVLVGSARSLPGFHAVRALDHVKDYLNHYGGHEQAAGFHLDKKHLDSFKKGLQAYAKEHFRENPLQIPLEIDFALTGSDLTFDSVKVTQILAPFGIGNPQPLFLLENIQIMQTASLGSDGKHLRFSVLFEGEVLDGIAFRFADHEEALLKASQLVVELDLKEWRGSKSLQLKLVDFS